MTKVLSKERFEEITCGFEKIDPIMVVGDVGLDKYTYGTVERISPEAPVPVLNVTKSWFKLGMAANVSENLKSLGARSTLCGIVGDDVHADVFENFLAKADLSTDGLVRDADRPTIVKERIVTGVQQICRVDYEDNSPLSEKARLDLFDCIQKLLPEHSAIILEDYAKGVFSGELCQEIIKAARRENKMVLVDPGRHAHPIWYKGASLIKPNQVECRTIVDVLGYHNEKELPQLVRIISQELEIENVIVTLGPGGMGIYHAGRNDLTVIPTVATEVFDVSGAGDTAISAVAASLLTGATLEEAAWIGNSASGVAVSKKGTANVSLDELRSFFKRLYKSVQ